MGNSYSAYIDYSKIIMIYKIYSQHKNTQLCHALMYIKELIKLWSAVEAEILLALCI